MKIFIICLGFILFSELYADNGYNPEDTDPFIEVVSKYYNFFCIYTYKTK